MSGKLHIALCHAKPLLMIALFAFLGTVIGPLFARAAGDRYIALLYTAVCCHLSVHGLLIAVMLPYCFIVFMTSRLRAWAIYLLIGFRFVLISSCGWAIEQSFQHGAWLVRLLLQFPDFCLIPVILWYTFRFLNGQKAYRGIVYCVIVLTGAIYYCFISPYLVTLIDTYETMGRYIFHVGFDWRL